MIAGALGVSFPTVSTWPLACLVSVCVLLAGAVNRNALSSCGLGFRLLLNLEILFYMRTHTPTDISTCDCAVLVFASPDDSRVFLDVFLAISLFSHCSDTLGSLLIPNEIRTAISNPLMAS